MAKYKQWTYAYLFQGSDGYKFERPHSFWFSFMCEESFIYKKEIYISLQFLLF